MNEANESLDPEVFQLWTPPAGRVVTVGPEAAEVPLPAVPLPIRREDLQGGEPSDDAIGLGIYDYLRHFPDCPHAGDYARLLGDAFPHYVADLGAQIVMLEHKEVDAPYVRRKIAGMKILALLDPDNPWLQQRLGMAQYELALMFTELRDCRRTLLGAMGHLQRSLKHLPDNPTSLNYLGQVDYLLGDYPAAVRRWRGIVDQLENGATREAFAVKIARIESGEVPDHPLVDDLEVVGRAMELYGRGEIEEALMILEQVEEAGALVAELPSAQFHHLLGMCRLRSGDPGTALVALEKALEIDPDYQPAQEAKDQIIDGRDH